MRETRVRRLEGEFEHAYRYLEVLFDGTNPYLQAIDRNLGFLDRILRTERWPLLRRNPPLFTSEDNQMGEVRGLMLESPQGALGVTKRQPRGLLGVNPRR